MTLPAVLRVDEVMARYGVKDERTARRVMNEAGAFKVGGRLVVREDDLGAWERRSATAGREPQQLVSTATRRPSRRAGNPVPNPATGPDWWRSEVA